MAEISEITLNIKIEAKALEDLNSHLEKLASSVAATGKMIESTFKNMAVGLALLARELRNANQEISIFGVSFDILKDDTGSLADLKFAIDRFKESLVFTNLDFIKDLTAFFKLLTQIVQKNPELTKFLTTMAAIGFVVLPLVGIFGGLAGAAKALGAVLGIAGLKVAAIAIAIGLVIAAAVLLIQNWDLVKESARDAWDYVTRAVSNAAHSILSFVLPIAGGFIGMWEGVKENAASAWSSIVETVTQQLLLLPNAVGIVMGGISESFNLAVQTIQTIWNNGIQYIKDNTGLDEFVLNLAESILRIFNGMVEGLKQLWRNFLNYLDENFPQVSGAAGFIKDRLGDAGNYVRETASDVEHAAMGTVGFITGLFKQHTGELGNFLSENYSRVTNFASNQIEVAGNFVREQTSTVGNFVKEQATNAGKALKDELSADNFLAGIIAPLNPFASIGIRAAKPLGILSSLRDRFLEIRNAMDQTGNQSGKTANEVGLLESILNSLRGETNLVGKSLNNGSQSFDEYEEGVNQAGEATKKWTEEELVALIQKINELQGVLGRIEFKNVLGLNVPFLKIDDKTTEDIAEVQETFEETSNVAQRSLDDLGVFAADIAAEINDTFADLIFRGLKNDFDNMKDFWKSSLDAMLMAFSQFIATVISNPIRIGLEMFLGGTSGSGRGNGGGGGFDLGLGNFFRGAGSSPFAEGAIFGANRPIPFVNDPVGTQIGQLFTLGAPLIGAGLGFTTGGLPGAIQGGLGGAGFLGGSILAGIPAIASALGSLASVLGPLGAVLGGLLGGVLGGLLKKTPRLDIDFDSIKTEVGRRAALVEEFLDPEFFMENIGQVSVKRGGVGVGAGGSNQILELIRERIEETIEGIQDIIAKLPTDMFRELNETLLNAEIDIDTVIAGERLLEFDAKGKKIAEKFQAFIEGELPAKFFAAIRDSFFAPAFQALGVSAEGTQQLIDDFMAKMEAAGSREERAAIGQEFLDTFGAFVDAFNIVSGNVNDSIGQTIQSVNNLSAKLGFDAVPSIDELRKTLGEMIENAEIDAETVQAYADLRNAIVSLMSEITSAITGLIGKINQLNTTIVSLGGSAVDTTGFLNTAATQLQDFLGANMGNLSLSEQEGFLDQLLGIANDMLAQEQAAFAEAQQAAREAAEKAAEAQRAAVQQRIDGLNAEKERVQDVYNERIEALNEELRIAEGFAQLTESIRRTLDSILYSPESVLTGIEQVNALQGNVAALQQELAGTTDPERQMEIVGRLEEAFKTLFGAAGDAFGVNSPEYVAIFDQVTGGLSGLAEMTESRARTVEEINAEIERLTAEQNSRLESIDAKIEAAQEQLSAIGTQEVEATFQASDRVKELFEYIRTEYMRILEERFAQLEEASTTGFATELEGLQAIAGTSEESLVTLKEQMAEAVTQTGLLTRIAEAFENLGEYNGGSGGLKDFGRGTLAVLHGKEAVVTEAQVRAMKKHMALAAEMTGGLGGALGGALETFAESIEGTGPLGRLERELVGAGRLTELADRVGTARITSMMEEFAGANAGAGAAGGLVERLAEKLSGEDGALTGLARRAAVEEVKNEMSVAISVNVNGGSGATVASIGNEIENMLVRSIKQGGKLRSAIQDAGAKRMR